MAAQQALEVLMVVMPPLRCTDILAHKLPSDEAVASGTAVDGEVLCATIRCLQVRGARVACICSVAGQWLLCDVCWVLHGCRVFLCRLYV